MMDSIGIAGALPDRVFQPMLLAGIEVEAVDVQTEVSEIQRQVLSEAQLVR